MFEEYQLYNKPQAQSMKNVLIPIEIVSQNIKDKMIRFPRNILIDLEYKLLNLQNSFCFPLCTLVNFDLISRIRLNTVISYELWVVYCNFFKWCTVIFEEHLPIPR